MRRRAPDEKIEAFRRRVHAPAGEALRRKLAGWAVTVLDEATEARPEMPDGVADRAADVWEALLAIADIAGGKWPERARSAAVVLVQVSLDVEPSLNLRLLADLRIVFGAEPEILATKTILAELCRLEDAPWSDLKGKPISDNQLARRLRQYDVKSKTIRINGVACKGYLRADLVDVWRRYLPPLAEKPVADVAPVTNQLFQDIGVTATGSEPVTDNAEPLHKANSATAATVNVEACNGLGDEKNPHEMGLATAATAATAFPGNGGDAPRPELAGDRSVGPRNRGVGLRQAGHDDRAGRARGRDPPSGSRAWDIFSGPEAVAIETERVMRCLFEGREAARMSEAGGEVLSIPDFLRR